jgi:Transposase DDE domain group 1
MLQRMGEQRVALLRADSGFCDSTFLAHLEERKMHYVIALRLQQPLQRLLSKAQEGWWPLQDERGKTVNGIELTRFLYQAEPWSKARWVVGIRQHVEQRTEARGKTLKLFADDPIIGKCRFSALVSDLELPALSIWRLYRGRADCENRIKELKYDFAADSFAMCDFWATEVELN